MGEELTCKTECVW